MPNFVARVRDSQGKSRTEKIVAESLVQARSTLRQQGFVVQELKQAQGFGSFDLNKLQTAMTKVPLRIKLSFPVNLRL